MTQLNNLKKLGKLDDKSLLIVDDDNSFRERLARAMEKKGFEVTQAESVKSAIMELKTSAPFFAVVDLRLQDGSGLDVVKEIQKLKKESRIIMLTGYGNIPTTVEAIKAGAIDYISKPTDADDIAKALLAQPNSKAVPPENPMSQLYVSLQFLEPLVSIIFMSEGGSMGYLTYLS